MNYRYAIADGGYMTRRPWQGNLPGYDWKEANEEELKKAEVGMIGACLSQLLNLSKLAATVVVAWDPDRSGDASEGEGSVAERRDIWPDYKADRTPPPPPYLEAVRRLQRLLYGLGVWQASAPGCEADDVAASFIAENDGPHVLWTADKDWLQLISKTIHVLRPDTRSRPRGVSREEWRREPDALLTPETLPEATGFDARGIRDVLVLGGDKTDGIPGLPRVGEEKKLFFPKSQTARSSSLVRACPDLVDLLLEGKDETARTAMFKANPKFVQWVDLVIDERELFQACFDLVRLRDNVPFEISDGETRGVSLGDVTEELEAEGLEYLVADIVKTFGLEGEDVPPWENPLDDEDLENCPF